MVINLVTRGIIVVSEEAVCKKNLEVREMTGRISDEVEGNPWELLWDNYRFIVSWVRDRKQVYRGFDDPDDALDYYSTRDVSTKSLHHIANISPQRSQNWRREEALAASR